MPPKDIHLANIILPSSPTARHDLTISSNTITSVRRLQNVSKKTTTAASDAASTTPASLLLPTLCHPHIHLDKPYLLTANHSHHPHASSDPSAAPLPNYTPLQPQSGSFSEALTLTSRAKALYTPDNLHLRGAQLLATSYTHGVTTARCFVEIDSTTHHKCLSAGLALRAQFASKVAVQLVAFAQDPLFSPPSGEANREQLISALETYARPPSDGAGQTPRDERIDVLGTTPYVEESRAAALRNIAWAIDAALVYDLHLDFHLDYNVDAARPPLVWDVLRLLVQAGWAKRAAPHRTIVLSHCSRLTLFSAHEMRRLARQIRENNLPVFFVGLPTSDLFMMGRPPSGADEGAHADSTANANANVEVHADSRVESDEDGSGSLPSQRQRGTLQLLEMRAAGLNVALGVNNVGNAFTPWGTGDPLALASLGVGLYQAGTEADANALFRAVTCDARRAIGMGRGGGSPALTTATGTTYTEGGGDSSALKDAEIQRQPDQRLDDVNNLTGSLGETGPWLLVRNEEWIGCPAQLGMKIPARQRVSVRDVVWDVPEVRLRSVVGGIDVAVQQGTTRAE